MAQMIAGFNKPYHFAQQKEVIIEHAGGKNVRIDPNAHEKADPNGMKCDFARWIAMPQPNGTVVIKSKHSGHYLRIHDGGSKLDVKGIGGKFCVFKVHRQNNDQNAVKLESSEFPGKYIAVRMGAVTIGAGGPFCILRFKKD